MSKQLPTIAPESLQIVTLTSEQKRKWLEALRSGHYEQGKMALVRHGRFCCLGVLGAVIGLDSRSMRDSAWLDSVMGDRCPLGPNSIPDHMSLQDILSLMNDDGDSFAEIADFIEQHIPACDEARS